jgi:hypothetical protein
MAEIYDFAKRLVQESAQLRIPAIQILSNLFTANPEFKRAKLVDLIPVVAVVESREG